ncbi:hypothetical protein N7471_005697 [Penicillium samsonianum]|uniref:uncharacterized protein n=1 Tax=Penicillium samsonianum TaxID=1882272 RepID=UPI002546B48F|nr:uncharacterized protein N7471_005697 [Penicillium samsonianum]KAJ6139211.1 hypothetical protein N7471_005697 [Penicillium samsonianum]
MKQKKQYKPHNWAKKEITAAGWPNGKALDYESRDCRFDPCVGHLFLFFDKIYNEESFFAIDEPN